MSAPILNRGLSTQYTFPRSFSMDAPPFFKRVDEAERVHQHGAIITADKKLKSRPLRIWGTLSSSTRPIFRISLEDMRKACYQDDPTLHADEYWPDKYLILDSVADFETTYLVSLRAADINILFRVTDPFWYANSETIRAWSITNANLTRTVSNGGSVEAYPVITYKAGGAQTRLRVRNNVNSEEFFYTRVMALNDEVEFDCVEGTVKLNGTDDIVNFTGPFLELFSGNNDIRTIITGTVGTSRIEFVFRARWL